MARLGHDSIRQTDGGVPLQSLETTPTASILAQAGLPSDIRTTGIKILPASGGGGGGGGGGEGRYCIYIAPPIKASPPASCQADFVFGGGFNFPGLFPCT
jgi:hypothetical protein